jgi:hypothetical protein
MPINITVIDRGVRHTINNVPDNISGLDLYNNMIHNLGFPRIYPGDMIRTTSEYIHNDIRALSQLPSVDNNFLALVIRRPETDDSPDSPRGGGYRKKYRRETNKKRRKYKKRKSTKRKKRLNKKSKRKKRSRKK